MRALRASPLRCVLRASGLAGRVVRPRTSTIPAALPRCLVRRLRLVWAISPLQGSSVASGGEDEAALVQHTRAVDLERRLGNDAVEVDRHGDRAADSDARAEGDVDAPEDLLVLEDIAREGRAIVGADAELGEVGARVPVLPQDAEELLALGAGRRREVPVLDRELGRVPAGEADRGDRARVHRPLSP